MFRHYTVLFRRLYGEEDELSAGLDEALDRTVSVETVAPAGDVLIKPSVSTTNGTASTLSKHSPLSTTLTNLAVDVMDVDDDYGDYADSDDYHY